MLEYASNKAKGLISKRVWQENKARQIVRKTNTHVCVSWGKKCSFFGKIWRALFSCNIHFEIRLFAFLSTNTGKKRVRENRYSDRFYTANETASICSKSIITGRRKIYSWLSFWWILNGNPLSCHWITQCI